MFFKKNLLSLLLILYSSYVAVFIGESWDEKYHYEIGKNVFNYLFTFGQIDKYLVFREYYSPSLWVFQYLVSLIFYNVNAFTLHKQIYCDGKSFQLTSSKDEVSGRRVF